MASQIVATILVAGGLATTGAMMAYEDRRDSDIAAYAESDVENGDRDREFHLDVSSGRGRERFGVRIAEDRPSVIVNAGRAGQAAFSMGQWQRRDDEDSDEDSEGDSERRGRRINRDRRDRDDGWWDRGRDRDNGRSRRRETGLGAVAYDHGFNGYDHGLQDGRDRRDHDPVRHRHYRSADRGYDGRLRPRERYRVVYRDGFRDGYNRGYRDGQDSRRNGRIRLVAVLSSDSTSIASVQVLVD